MIQAIPIYRGFLFFMNHCWEGNDRLWSDIPWVPYGTFKHPRGCLCQRWNFGACSEFAVVDPLAFLERSNNSVWLVLLTMTPTSSSWELCVSKLSNLRLQKPLYPLPLVLRNRTQWMMSEGISLFCQYSRRKIPYSGPKSRIEWRYCAQL